MPIPTSSETPSNSNITPNPVTDSEIPGATSSTSTSSSSSNSDGGSGSQTKSEAEEVADRLYEERIEDEMAKRESGC